MLCYACVFVSGRFRGADFLIKTNTLIKQGFINLYYNQKYVYIMLGEKVFTSKHVETIITILNVVQ